MYNRTNNLAATKKLAGVRWHQYYYYCCWLIKQPATYLVASGEEGNKNDKKLFDHQQNYPFK
jgi:hypothetical protein